MSINVTAHIPIKILSVFVSDKSFIKFLDSITVYEQIGIKRNGFYIINTDKRVGWMNSSLILDQWHNFLFLIRIKGFTLLSIKIKE